MHTANHLFIHTHTNAHIHQFTVPKCECKLQELALFCIEVVHRNCTIIPLMCVQRLVAFGKTKLFIGTSHTLFVLERERKQQLGKW